MVPLHLYPFHGKQRFIFPRTEITHEASNVSIKDKVLPSPQTTVK